MLGVLRPGDPVPRPSQARVPGVADRGGWPLPSSPSHFVSIQRGSTPNMSEADIEKYRAVRGQIEHESTLVGIRLGWLIAAESFLFAGYATVLTVTEGAPDKFGSKAHTLFDFLPIAGMVLAACVGVSIFAALLAMGRLKDNYKQPGTDSGLPPIAGNSDLIYYLGSTAPFLVPGLTFAGWAYLLFSQ
jgi:hypothetical protein